MLNCHVGIAEQTDDTDLFNEEMSLLRRELSTLFGWSHAPESEIQEQFESIR